MQFQDNSFSIGRTPLVRLNRVMDGATATVLAKIEARNPAFSVKCRIGASMVWDAEQRGVLKPGKELIEPTSGNTGIALAFVAAARGYPITLTMPETMSIERRKVLKAFGANLVLTEGLAGHEGRHPRRPSRSAPPIPIVTSCCSSSRIPRTRRSTSRPRVLKSGRTRTARSTCSCPASAPAARSPAFPDISKVRRAKRSCRLRSSRRNSPVISQKLRGEELKPGPHKIQGIGAGFIPDTLDISMVDRVELVTNDESIEMARRLAREEGLLSGISCGAAVAAAARVAKQPEMAGKTIVVVLPDAGERYLSSPLFEGMFNE